MRVFVVLLACLGAAMAAPDGVTRIVGGSEASIQEYPFMSNMEYALFGFFWLQWCGGSLITTHSVLSAAHCFVGDHHSEWRVRLGSAHVSSGGSVHPASNILIHQEYDNQRVDPDIAIVRLATPAIVSATVAQVSIAGPNYHLNDGASVTAIGWGALQPGGSGPTFLQHVHINVINQQICTERYAYLKTLPGFQNWPDVTPGMLCAGILDVGGKDACQGDSGGPLVHQNVLVGVTSWGYSCAHEFYPGVNARVSYYANWITANA